MMKETTKGERGKEDDKRGEIKESWLTDRQREGIEWVKKKKKSGQK